MTAELFDLPMDTPFPFSQAFSIADRKVGPGRPVLFIAEAGVAHFGDPKKAETLVDLAAEAGADIFKTQAFQTDQLIAASLPEWRDRLRPKEVDFDFLSRMKERCDDKGLIFLCTAHDETVLPWLVEWQVPAIKVGSGERGNLPFLRTLAELGKPIILSTGMYSQEDVRATLTALAETGNPDLALLHCVTSYPTPYDQLNLRAMDQLKGLFPGPVGYSDHTQGHHAILAAVALGATIVEKHITLDFDIPNAQDWKVSAGPDDLAILIQQIREVEQALGTGEKMVQPCEIPALDWALKSLVARTPLNAGHPLSADMLVAKRPGGGIPPSELDTLMGRVLTKDLAADTMLSWEDLQ